AVGDVRLVARLVEEDLRDAAERPQVVAARARVPEPELLPELSVAREFQDVAVRRPVAADPDDALAVDGDAVVAFGPLVALAGSAPVIEQVAGLIELEHGRCRGAALAGRRVPGSPQLLGVQ